MEGHLCEVSEVLTIYEH